MTNERKEGLTAAGKWILTVIASCFIALVSWSASRECARNDVQDIRINALERAVVGIEYMQADMREMKQDVKKLITKGE